MVLMNDAMTTTTSKPVPFSYDRSREAAHTDKQQPCACCGKAVKDAQARYFVHVVSGGVAYGGEADTDDAGDMGWFPVGPSCAKKLRAAGVFVGDWADKAKG